MNEARKKKLEGSVQEIITWIIFEEVDGILENHWVITITWVKISSELSYLDIFVSCFRNKESLAHDLAEYNSEIQRKLNKSLPLYKLPKIRFRYDDSGRISIDMEAKIKEIQKEIS